MVLTTEQLTEAFPQARLKAPGGADLNRLLGIAPLESALEDFLLVGSASRYNTGTRPGVFALIEDESAVPKDGDTLLLFPKGTDICDVFTNLSAVFRQAEESAAARHALEQAALFASPREAVSAAADLLGTDLFLYNALGEQIAASVPDAPRRVGSEALADAVPFYAGSSIVAYLAGRLNGCREDDLRFVRKHLEASLRRSAADTPGQYFSSELLLARLISGRDLPDAELRFYADLCGWDPEGTFCLLAADRDHLPVDNALVTFINRVESASDAGTLVTEHSVLFLFTAANTAEYEARLHSAEAVFSAEGASAAVSRIFTGLREVGTVFSRMKAMLPFLPEDAGSALRPYDEAAYLVAASGYRTLSDLHPLCRTLLELDRSSKFPCSETVYEYLLHSQSPADVCRALHIHRNTLDYRLGRLSELCDIDFSDGGEMACLLFSLHAARRLGLSAGTETTGRERF